MIDFSALDPLGLSYMAFPYSDFRDFSDETESLKSKIIDEARKESEHCSAFVDYVFEQFDDDISVRAMFSATAFSKIIRACNSAEDSIIKEFYLKMYHLVCQTLWELPFYDHHVRMTADIFKRNKIAPDDLPTIEAAIESLQRIPVALILDKYLKARPKQLMDYVDSSTFIYSKSSKEVDLSGAQISSEMHEKLISSLYRICNQLRRQARAVNQSRYKNLSWEAINAQEGTNFSQAFITWLKWATIDAKYIGTRERNDGFPSWCFAPYSMDVCYGRECLTGIGNLYDKLIDTLSTDREHEVRIPLEPYYNGHVLPDDVIYRPLFVETSEDENQNEEETDAEEVPGEVGYHVPQFGEISSVSDFNLLCQRIITEMDCDMYVDGSSIVIPSGRGITKYQLIRKI